MNLIKWVGTVASVAGSFLVSAHFFTLGYCFFLLGAVSWLYVGWHSKDKAMLTLNGFFLSANVLGLYNALY
jgi:hypothetical protein